MKDYLWDKTGDDPEIRKLENVLAVFAYQENAAPALVPLNSMQVQEKAPRWRFSLAFAFAACAAVVILLVGVWFQISSGRNGAKEDLAGITPVNNDSTVNDGDKLRDEKLDAEIREARRSTTIVRRGAISVKKRNKATDRFEVKKAAAALTNEEKYAYDQLMLALSITTSKLQIVQDRINGIEDGQTDSSKDNR